MKIRLTLGACISLILLAGTAGAQSSSTLLGTTWEAQLCLDNTSGKTCSSTWHIQPEDLFGADLDGNSEIFVFLEKTEWGSVHSFPSKAVTLCQQACKNPTLFASFMDFGAEKTFQITVIRNQNLSKDDCSNWLNNEAPVNEMQPDTIEEQCKLPVLVYWHIATLDPGNGEQPHVTIPPGDGHGTGTPPN